MRTRISAVIIGVGLLCGVLGGCTGDDPSEGVSSSPVVIEPPPMPSPSPSPTWTSEEQAAIDAVFAYLERWTYISQNLLEVDWESLYEVASGDLAMYNQEHWTNWSNNGWHLEGAPVFTPELVIEGMTNFEGTQYIVRGCFDVENAYLVDSEGNRAEVEGRVERGPISYVALHWVDGWYSVTEDTPEEGIC